MTSKTNTAQQRKVELADLDTEHGVKGGYQIELKKARVTSYDSQVSSVNYRFP